MKWTERAHAEIERIYARCSDPAILLDSPLWRASEEPRA